MLTRCSCLWVGGTRLVTRQHSTMIQSSQSATLTMEHAAKYFLSLTLTHLTDTLTWRIIKVTQQENVVKNEFVLSQMRTTWISGSGLRTDKRMVCPCWLMLIHSSTENIRGRTFASLWYQSLKRMFFFFIWKFQGHQKGSYWRSLMLGRDPWWDRMVGRDSGMMIVSILWRFLCSSWHWDPGVHESHQNCDSRWNTLLLLQWSENVLHWCWVPASLL